MPWHQDRRFFQLTTMTAGLTAVAFPCHSCRFPVPQLWLCLVIAVTLAATAVTLALMALNLAVRPVAMKMATACISRRAPPRFAPGVFRCGSLR